MDIFIIEQRIDQLSSQKANWMKKKKDQRGNNVKELDDKISRLKRWKKDLKHKESLKKVPKAMNNLSKGMKGLQDTMDHAVDAMSMFGSLSSVFQKVREADERKRDKKR